MLNKLILNPPLLCCEKLYFGEEHVGEECQHEIKSLTKDDIKGQKKKVSLNYHLNWSIVGLDFINTTPKE